MITVKDAEGRYFGRSWNTPPFSSNRWGDKNHAMIFKSDENIKEFFEEKIEIECLDSCYVVKREDKFCYLGNDCTFYPMVRTSSNIDPAAVFWSEDAAKAYIVRMCDVCKDSVDLYHVEKVTESVGI